MIAGGPDTDDFNAAGYALYHWDRIEHVDGNRISRTSPLIIVDALVHHADKVYLVRIANVEYERPLRIGLGASFLPHALIQTLLVQTGFFQTEKNHFCTSRRPAASLIADHAFDKVRGRQRRGTTHSEGNIQDKLACPRFLSEDSDHQPSLVLAVALRS